MKKKARTLKIKRSIHTLLLYWTWTVIFLLFELSTRFLGKDRVKPFV